MSFTQLGTASSPKNSLSKNQWGILAAILFLCLTPGLMTIPVMDRDEARYSQASTQMMETGDYIDIRFQDQKRHVKPVGIYWMQTITTRPFGGPDAPIWAFRLPSYFGIMIAAFATAWLGARIVSARAGLVAGAIVGMALATAIEARTAKTDAMLLASAALAQGALFMLITRDRALSPPKFWGAPALFWFASGLAIIIKGPIVSMVSATTVIGYALWTWDRSFLKNFRVLPGVALMLAVALPWFILITIQTGGAFFQEAVGHALLGKVAKSDDSHAGPIGYYTMLLPALMWPGSIFLGLAGLVAWVRRHEPVVKFLLCWIIPTWIIFEFVATKLPHYVLPTFPAIAILAVIGMTDAKQLLTLKAGKWLHYGLALVLFVIVTMVVAILPVAGADYLGDALWAPANVATLVAGLVTLGAGIAVMFGMTDRRLMIFGGAAIATYIALMQFAIPGLNHLWPSHHVAKLVAQLEGCESIPAATAGYREPSNVFHLGTDTLLTDGPGAAVFLAEHKECGIAIVDESERDAFDAALPSELSSVSVGQVEGQNTVKGRDLKLDILMTDQSRLSKKGEAN